MIGKSTKFSHVGQNKCKLFANHTFSPVFQGYRLHTQPSLFHLLQNYEGMKALYDFINSVIVIVNVIVTSSLPSSSVLPVPKLYLLHTPHSF